MPIASCQCGALTPEVAAYSPMVVACHCLDCQRRTGSALGVAAYYPETAVTVAGTARTYTRPTATGGAFVQRFCPTCGSTLLWSTARHPGLIGIAAGAFADPHAPPPLRSVWEQSAHPWLGVASAVEHFPRGRA